MNYVSGILIDWQLDVMLLCRKQGTVPLTYVNKWNSIGGKIEQRPERAGIALIIPEEYPHEAMVREFKEETGLTIAKNRWICFLIKEYKNKNKCYFFAAFGDEPKKYDFTKITYTVQGKEDLVIDKHSLIDILFSPQDYQYDLPYIVNMLITESRAGRLTGLNPEGINTSA